MKLTLHFVVRRKGGCVCTRLRLFTVLALNGVELEWSIVMDFYSQYLHKYDTQSESNR